MGINLNKAKPRYINLSNKNYAYRRIYKRGFIFLLAVESKYSNSSQAIYNMDLTPDLIFSLLQSSDPFPVDLDDAWQWLGYSQKSECFKKLKKHFEKDLDFSCKGMKSLLGGRPSDYIVLTVECFKSLGMMAGTAKGKQVRRYFLDCETELKRRIEEDRKNSKDRVIKLLVCDAHTTWQPRFKEEFFDEAYRVTGYKRSIKGHPSCMGGFIKNNVYMYFPEGTLDKLEQVNPSEKGRRKRKHHQHLQDFGLSILDSQKTAALAVMRLSPDNNPKKFHQNMEKALGRTIQIELPFLEDLQAS